MRVRQLMLFVIAGCMPLLAAAWSSPGKPGAPVTLDAPVVRAPVGETVNFSMELIATSVVDSMSVELLPSPGLGRVLIGATTASEIAGGAATLPISLRGLADGQHYLNLLVTTERSGLRSMRSFAVPILVGNGQWLNQSKAIPSDDGQAVLSLPAKESIR